MALQTSKLCRLQITTAALIIRRKFEILGEFAQYNAETGCWKHDSHKFASKGRVAMNLQFVKNVASAKSSEIFVVTIIPGMFM